MAVITIFLCTVLRRSVHISNEALHVIDGVRAVLIFQNGLFYRLGDRMNSCRDALESGLPKIATVTK